jgi:N-acetylglutamate synthase-like GNAT family acetyltransferase
MLGCAALEKAGGYAVVHSVSVEKSWRRHGIGTTLMRRCLKDAKSRGFQAIGLTTIFWNIRFFKRMGFRTVSREKLPASLQEHPDFSSRKFPYVTPMLLFRLPRKKGSPSRPTFRLKVTVTCFFSPPAKTRSI